VIETASKTGTVGEIWSGNYLIVMRLVIAKDANIGHTTNTAAVPCSITTMQQWRQQQQQQAGIPAFVKNTADSTKNTADSTSNTADSTL